MSDWSNLSNITRRSFKCGYCGKDVAPSSGYFGQNPAVSILICPNCSNPTFFTTDGEQNPKTRLGEEIQGITDLGVAALYNEARDCTAVGAFTSAVLICRKILMNLAVQHGANENEKFIYYVDYLATAGYVPPNGKAWVDEIRKKGNEATHEIKIMNEPEAKQILKFVEMLLRFNFEFPTMLNPSP